MKFASCLAAIILCALVLRVWNLSAQSLDMDEFAESRVGELTYVEAANRADSMPPLYPIMLKTWLAICPRDLEVPGRWLSMAIGVATIGVIGLTWPRPFGPRLALTVAGLLAVSPLHIFYSQHVRGYVLLFFWTALAMAALVSAVKSERRSDWLLFVMSSLGGLYTHYYFALFWGVLCLVVGWPAYGWKMSRQWWIACVVVGLMSLPLLGFVRHDLSFQKSLREARPMGVGAFGYTYLSMATGFSVGPAKNELQQMPLREALVAGAPIAAVVGSIYLVLGGWGVLYLSKRQQAPLALVLIFVPVLIVGLLGRAAGVTYNPRFVVWSLLPLLMLLAAGAIQGSRSWLARGAAVGLVLVSILAIYNRHTDARYQKEDVRAVGEYLAGQTEERGPVFVVPSYMTPLVVQAAPTEFVPVKVPSLEQTIGWEDSAEEVDEVMQALRSEMPTEGVFWVFYSRAFHGDPQGELLLRLKEEWKVAKQQEFAGVVLYRGDAANVK